MEILFNIFTYGFGLLFVLLFCQLSYRGFISWLDDKTDIFNLMGFIVMGMFSILLISLYVWLLF